MAPAGSDRDFGHTAQPPDRDVGRVAHPSDRDIGLAVNPGEADFRIIENYLLDTCIRYHQLECLNDYL